MASATVLEAFITKLKTISSVTALLATADATSIFVLGRVQGQQNSPYITVGELMTRGKPYSDQMITTMRVRVYFGDQQGNSSMQPLAKIVPLVRQNMDRVDLGTITGIGFMDCRWNGYQSEDRYDYALRHYYQELRFDLYLGRPMP